MMNEAKPNGQYNVSALWRGLAILQMFRQDRPRIKVSDCERELGIPRATAYRLVHTLQAGGFLVADSDSGGVRLGPRVLKLGFEFLHQQDIIETARPYIVRLRDRTGMTSHMGILDGREAVYIYRAASRQRAVSNITVGTRLPAHAVSIGRALLMGLRQEDLESLFADVTFEIFSDQTPRNLPELIDRLAHERQQGYVLYRAAYARGICSCAAPVRNHVGHIIAGINISDYEDSPGMDALETHIKDEVLATAEEISTQLGYVPDRRPTAPTPD